MSHVYKKLDENYKLKHCPMNDTDGSITGKIIINVPAYFDENPSERIRLGWIKHIQHDAREAEYNHQTQYLVRSTRQIDDYTVEDVFNVMDKTEEMLLLEELLNVVDSGGITFIGGEFE